MDPEKSATENEKTTGFLLFFVSICLPVSVVALETDLTLLPNRGKIIRYLFLVVTKQRKLFFCNNCFRCKQKGLHGPVHIFDFHPSNRHTKVKKIALKAPH
jgi:hypothetical protein